MKENDNYIPRKPAERRNEFLGCEIEAKLQNNGDYDEDAFIALRKVIAGLENFNISEDLSNFNWIFYFDYYGYNYDGKINPLFILIHHPSTPKYWIRRKENQGLNNIGNSEEIMVRKEFTQQIDGDLSQFDIESILEIEQQTLGRNVFMVGRVTRDKKYFFTENSMSTRGYSVSLDFSQFDNRAMSQLEIEYKWIRSGKPGLCPESNVQDDLLIMTNEVIASFPDNRFCRTRLTKWQWLIDCKKL